MTSRPVSRTSRRAARPEIIRAAVLDAVLILVFVLIGRTSHGEDASVGGVLTTAWPFLVGGIVGWIIARAWLRPSPIVPTGFIVWASTLVVGMILRAVSGQGTEVPFIIVTTIVLAVLLLGWRAVARILGRRRARA